MVSSQGINITPFVVPWSVIVSIELNPFDSGNFVIKSILIVLKGSGSPHGVMGFSGGLFGCVIALFCWHIRHPLMYSCMNLLRSGHQ